MAHLQFLHRQSGTEREKLEKLREGNVICLNGKNMLVTHVSSMNDNIARKSFGMELKDEATGEEFFLELGMEQNSRPFLCEICRNPGSPEKWTRKRKLVVSSFSPGPDGG